MAKKITPKKLGHYAFLLGILLAIIAAFVSIPYLGLMLIILGVVIGLVNITAKETTEFLIATIALVIAGIASSGIATIPFVGIYIAQILANIVALVVPAAIIVALKAIKVTADK